MSKILIVDDSPDLLEVMEYVLNCREYKVKSLNNAHNIKREISDFQPGLIILDIFLADEDGRNICKDLKEDKDTLHIPILVFSASPESLKDYESYCADGVIEKPFMLNQLIEKITSVFQPKKAETIF